MALALAGAGAAGCAGSAPPGPEPAAGDAVPLFVEAAAATGLDFVHFNGMSGEYYFCEIVGPGAALLDYDGDGDLDAYLVQGSMLGEGKTVEDALVAPRSPLTGRLYRNDLAVTADGARTLRFTDVTAEAGLEAAGYGMGAATGDYDGDGRPDLYLTFFGPNQLWRNRGDGTFEETTAAAGVDEARWSTSAAFFDYDGDGRLDLFSVQYVDFRLAANKHCRSPSSRRDYCGPQSYEGSTDRLWHNRGDGTFEDVSGAAGLLAAAGAGLGVVTADFDGDGRTDVYVANDQMRNNLWRNRGDGTFRDQALAAGCAVDAAGRAQASMGVDAGDVDNDGDDDLFMTHLRTETNTLYENHGGGLFEDRTVHTRLATPSLGATGFGTAFFDFDLDGWLDLVAVNGAVTLLEDLAAAGDPFPLHQPNQLFRNRGDGTFEEVTAAAGAAFALSEVSRGVAVGDVDDDGDPDLLVTNNNGPARLLLDQADRLAGAGWARRWLGLRLVTREGRDALGAVVEVERRRGPPLTRRAHSDSSFLSARDPRVLVGLGDDQAVAVRVRWPDGTAERWPAPPPGRYTTLVQGTGRPEPGVGGEKGAGPGPAAAGGGAG